MQRIRIFITMLAKLINRLRTAATTITSTMPYLPTVAPVNVRKQHQPSGGDTDKHSARAVHERPPYRQRLGLDFACDVDIRWRHWQPVRLGNGERGGGGGLGGQRGFVTAGMCSLVRMLDLEVSLERANAFCSGLCGRIVSRPRLQQVTQGGRLKTMLWRGRAQAGILNVLGRTND